MPRRVFTPVVIKAVREMASKGKTAPEIAATIGSTTGSVRVMCSQLKIQLLRRGRPSLVPGFPPHNEHKLVVNMRLDDYAALKRKAVQMHKSPVEFAAMLLKAIIGANLFDAVLDDRE
jgi:hypothetical protein